MILSGVDPFLGSISVTVECYYGNINILFYIGIAFVVLSIFYVFLTLHNINKREIKH